MENTTEVNNSENEITWQTQVEKRHWLGKDITITYASYLVLWWMENKTDYFAKIVSAK